MLISLTDYQIEELAKHKNVLLKTIELLQDGSIQISFNDRYGKYGGSRIIPTDDPTIVEIHQNDDWIRTLLTDVDRLNTLYSHGEWKSSTCRKERRDVFEKKIAYGNTYFSRSNIELSALSMRLLLDCLSINNKNFNDNIADLYERYLLEIRTRRENLITMMENDFPTE